MATDLRIGGRLETVAPRQVTDSGDRLRLLGLLAVAIVVHIVVFANTKMTARDSIGFARNAHQLEAPKTAGFEDIIDLIGDHDKLTNVQRNNFPHPPGYPLAVLFVSFVVRATVPIPLPEQLLLSTQIVSGVAAVLLIFPTYWLGRSLFGKTEGFVAGLLFTVLPASAQITSDGLTEALFLLGIGTALTLGVRAIRKQEIGGFLLCGLTTGAAYLVRPEGALVAASVGGVGLWLGANKTWSWSATAARLTALTVGFLILAAPYMILIGGFTNKQTGNGLLGIKSPRQMIAHGPTGPTLFAGWYDPDVDGSRAVWVPKVLLQETSKAFHYLPLGLAAIGLGVAVRRLRAEPWLLVPMLFGALTLLILIALAGFKSNPPRPYLSERHCLPLAYVGCFFAAGGLAAIPGMMAQIFGPTSPFARPAVPWLILGLVVATCIPGILKQHHRDRIGHKLAGEILREQATDEDTIIDPWSWALFYSGRTLGGIKGDPPPLAGRYRWVVMEPGEGPHSELPRLPAARGVVNDLENPAIIVAHWPEDKPLAQAKVVLYKQRIRESEEAAWRIEHQKAIAAALKKAEEEAQKKAEK